MSSSSGSRETGLQPVLTPDDLAAYMTAQGIDARLVRDLGDTRTVPLAAIALGVDVDQVIKSLLFLVRLPDRPADPQPVLVIVGGQRLVDYRALAAYFGVSRKKARMAAAEAVLAILGYPAGGVPPFGHRTRVPAIIDAALLAGQVGDGTILYGGGGDEGTMLEITLAELLRVVQPDVLSVSSA
jgi:prolyl-tRNA editing enzyme YbaK/EbsC (Cys-tRNA(Pro) deacylase)